MTTIIAAVILAAAVLVAAKVIVDALRDASGTIADGLRFHREDLVKAQENSDSLYDQRSTDANNALRIIHQGLSKIRSEIREWAPGELVSAKEDAERKAQAQTQRAQKAVRAAINATQVEVRPDELMDAAATRGFERGVAQHAEAVKQELKAALPGPEALAA